MARLIILLKGLFAPHRIWLITWLIIAIFIALVIHFWPQPASPVPQYITNQTSFPVIYPSGYEVDSRSWKYNQQDKSVEFIVKKGEVKTVFTEEKTPLAYQNDLGAYNRFIGSLRPRANFDVSLGTVSISNFVTAGDYQVVGETGILNAKGTLLLAHPDTNMSDDEWRNMFESLKVN